MVPLKCPKIDPTCGNTGVPPHGSQIPRVNPGDSGFVRYQVLLTYLLLSFTIPIGRAFLVETPGLYKSRKAFHVRASSSIG